ncbi:hypothetical protein M569_12768 [Genlisea aurea]|uniref:Uncharacterized protein n=1 Tax=Genlisea aurea TaxID=192259 RepID=S8C5E2_9LAMI|nr:hypothetical protein M569_12768 [Genlisea aurea]
MPAMEPAPLDLANLRKMQRVIQTSGEWRLELPIAPPTAETEGAAPAAQQRPHLPLEDRVAALEQEIARLRLLVHSLVMRMGALLFHEGNRTCESGRDLELWNPSCNRFTRASLRTGQRVRCASMSRMMDRFLATLQEPRYNPRNLSGGMSDRGGMPCSPNPFLSDERCSESGVMQGWERSTSRSRYSHDFTFAR